MGIHNINALISPDLEYHGQRAQQLAETIMARRIEEHRRGEHPDGRKFRDCPLCQQGK